MLFHGLRPFFWPIPFKTREFIPIINLKCVLHACAGKTIQHHAKILLGWELMPRRSHIGTWETHFFTRRYESSYGNHSWEIILRYANFFTHGAEWEIMPRRIHMRTRENDFSWEGVRNHDPVGIFQSFLKWWHFSKFKNCCLIIFFLSPEIENIF